jgi:plastocyanin
MRRHRPLLTTAAITLIAVTGLAACGDTSADDASTDMTATTAESGGSGGGAPADCDMAPGETVTVEIPEFMFSPDPVEISACDSVVWKNTHTQAHTSTGKGDKAWSTDNIAAGSESEPVLFDETGSFAYICALHPFMKGTVEVS